MAFGTLAGALAQAVVVFVVGWIVGDVILRRVFGDRITDIGVPERALCGIVGFVALSVAFELANIVTGGAVFGVPFVIPAVTLVGLVLARRHVQAPHGVEWVKTMTLSIPLVVLYLVPVIAGGSGVRTGDPPWHLGWTEQLLHGEVVPTGPAAEYARNAYPWGWHAVLATVTRLVPSTTPLVAHEGMHIVLILAIPLAAACIARRIDVRAGWWAAGAASLIGGFGWIAARTADFVTSPTQARYGADLVVASPNSVYELLPPALPRELGLVALGAAAVWVVWATRSEDRRVRAGAGVVVGLVGLVSVPLFVSALLWTVVAWVAARAPARRLVDLVVAALVTFGFWAGPVVVSFVRYGGFVNITPQLGKEWPVVTALSSWGLLLPLAVLGAVVAWRLRTTARPVLAMIGATAILLGLAIARGEFGWNLAGNATLLHQGRVWPPAHLLAAALAGVALAALFARLRKRSSIAAVATAVVVFGMGAASPALAARGLTKILEHNKDGFIYATEDVLPGSFVDRASALLGPDDVVSVPGSDRLAFLLFEFSGCRLAAYDDPSLPNNDLRIRYRELAARWDERERSGGFRPDYIVLPAATRPGQRYEARGVYEGELWVLLKLSR
ncbi:MAG TPA: hypothetical protein VFK89_10480 [Actinomycetota bacterium]|nr:hypothetical protein [Actinomycetota bacterium]